MIEFYAGPAQTLAVCGPSSCHGCAPFAKDCVSGIVKETTGRPLAAADTVAPPPPEPAPVVFTYRARYAKEGRLRFVSHLDLIRTLPKVLRRAKVRMAYSVGFHPKPRLSFGPALAVGLESRAEYLDFESLEPLDGPAVVARLNAASPPGMTFTEVRLVDGERAVAEGAKQASYSARLVSPPSGAALARLALAQAGADINIVRTRKGESTEVPLGPQLRELFFDRDGNLQMTLALDAGVTLRPGEVLRGLVGDEADGVRVVRSELWVERGGRLVTPLPPA
jgi:radical SAM-linked protein